MNQKANFRNYILFFHQGKYQWTELNNDIFCNKLIEENRSKFSRVNSYFLGSYQNNRRTYVILSCEIPYSKRADRGGVIGFHHVIAHEGSYDRRAIEKELSELYKEPVKSVNSIYSYLENMSKDEAIRFLKKRYVKTPPTHASNQHNWPSTGGENRTADELPKQEVISQVKDQAEIDLQDIKDQGKMRATITNIILCLLVACVVGLFFQNIKMQDQMSELIESQDQMSELIESQQAVEYFQLSREYSMKNEHDLAIRLLQRAITLDESWIEYANQDSSFDNIRSNPQFQKIVDSFGQP